MNCCIFQGSRIWSIGLCIKWIDIGRRLSSSLQLKLGFYLTFLSIYTMEELSFVVHSPICKFSRFPIFRILGLRWSCLIFCFPWTEMEVVFTIFYFSISSDFASCTCEGSSSGWYSRPVKIGQTEWCSKPEDQLNLCRLVRRRIYASQLWLSRWYSRQAWPNVKQKSYYFNAKWYMFWRYWVIQSL